ncbi:D-alanine--D-alanine ligase [Candidatus Peregrinibacteria bacterium]|jgi:D-alanine-D-alanine ligase|nr:D-alanine--D-alanine ligase [Candidatus Peregrinibacteria bacterium]MBT4056314.1 D-alanine--D-alanine ligase [Candidatus Peregrinibacteria bacterium]
MAKTVGVIFGGKSGEHEVSLVSSESVIREMPEQYDVKEIGISVDGVWFCGEGTLARFKAGRLESERFDEMEPCTFEEAFDGCDIVFPVLHGPFGEDGTIQGLFEMAGIPYVGCGVLASSACMDKLTCKSVLDSAGIPVVPYIGFTRAEWEGDPDRILKRADTDIGFPCFVKPSNMGSSVGITKVKELGDLREAIDLAAQFDTRILVEKGVNAREIECAVLGNGDAEAAELGEIIVGGEFYDFNDKYIDGKSTTEVPANDMDPAKRIEIQTMCVNAFREMDCSGLSRVDAFLDRDSGEIYLNEINTLPGFTSISMYPEMWAASGVAYPELIGRLIQLGFERFEDRSRNQSKFESGTDWFK